MKTMHNSQSIMHHWLRRSWRIVLLLSIFNCQLSIVNSVSAQQTQDALYIYRNDGGFHGFFYWEIERMAYSNIDTLGVAHDDFVVQEIYARDTVYRVPISAIDSISFVTPENVYKEDVAYRTESDVWNYVIRSSEDYSFVLAPNTPSSMIPKVGDKMAKTKETVNMPYEIYGVVSSVNANADGIVVTCEPEDIANLFDEYMMKTSCLVTAEEVGGVRRMKVRKLDEEPYKEDKIYNSDSLGIDIDIENMSYLINMFSAAKANKDKDVKGNVIITGEGPFRLKFIPVIKLSLFYKDSKTTGLKVNINTVTDLSTDLRLDYKGAITFRGDFTLPELETLVGPFRLHANCGLSGNISVSNIEWYYEMKDRRSVTGTLLASLNNRNEPFATGTTFLPEAKIEPFEHKSESKLITGNTSIQLGGFCNIGVALLTKYAADLSLRMDIAEKLTVLGGLNFLGSKELPTVRGANPTAQYDNLMGKDYLNISPIISGKAIFSVGPPPFKIGKTITLYNEKMETNYSCGVVPTFTAPYVNLVNGSNSFYVLTDVGGNLFWSVPVGFAIYDDETNKMVARDWYTQKYLDEKNSFRDFTLPFDLLSAGDYIVYPIIKAYGYDMLCSPWTRFTIKNDNIPPSKTYNIDFNAGSTYLSVELPSGKKTRCEYKYTDGKLTQRGNDLVFTSSYTSPSSNYTKEKRDMEVVISPSKEGNIMDYRVKTCKVSYEEEYDSWDDKYTDEKGNRITLIRQNKWSYTLTDLPFYYFITNLYFKVPYDEKEYNHISDFSYTVTRTEKESGSLVDQEVITQADLSNAKLNHEVLLRIPQGFPYLFFETKKMEAETSYFGGFVTFFPIHYKNVTLEVKSSPWIRAEINEYDQLVIYADPNDNYYSSRSGFVTVTGTSADGEQIFRQFIVRQEANGEDLVEEELPDESIMRELAKHMPIHEGNNPPDINGSYKMAPKIVCYSNRGNTGKKDDPKVFIFKKTSSGKYRYSDYDETSSGPTYNSDYDTAYTQGSGNNFTIGRIKTLHDIDDDNPAAYVKIAYVISGTVTSEGISNLYYAEIVLEGQDADIYDPVGTITIWKDEDGMSDSSPWEPLEDEEE